jgi:hypothetical protein
MVDEKKFLWKYYKTRAKENKKEELKSMREEISSKYHNFFPAIAQRNK